MGQTVEHVSFFRKSQFLRPISPFLGGSKSDNPFRGSFQQWQQSFGGQRQHGSDWERQRGPDRQRQCDSDWQWQCDCSDLERQRGWQRKFGRCPCW